jgi:hypothetical protein
MRFNRTLAILVASALVAAPAAAVAQGNGNKGATDAQKRAQVERSQRDLDRDRLRTQDRDRTQDRIHAPGDAQQGRMYGYGLMTDAEREAYQARLAKAETAEEREQIKAQHRKEMEVRAQERNVKVDENGDPIPEE